MRGVSNVVGLLTEAMGGCWRGQGGFACGGLLLARGSEGASEGKEPKKANAEAECHVPGLVCGTEPGSFRPPPGAMLQLYGPHVGYGTGTGLGDADKIYLFQVGGAGSARHRRRTSRHSTYASLWPTDWVPPGAVLLDAAGQAAPAHDGQPE